MLRPPFASWSAVVACFLACLSSAAQVTLAGSTVELSGIHYYVPSKAVASVSASLSDSLHSGNSAVSTWLPITVVKAPGVGFGIAELQSTIKTFGVVDDVWNPGFLSGGVPNPTLDGID